MAEKTGRRGTTTPTCGRLRKRQVKELVLDTLLIILPRKWGDGRLRTAPGIVHIMPGITNGSLPRVPDTVLAASGGQAHRSAMQVNPTRLDSQERWTTAPTTPRHDIARKVARATHDLPPAIFIFPKKTMA
jgi:hypothetical protein